MKEEEGSKVKKIAEDEDDNEEKEREKQEAEEEKDKRREECQFAQSEQKNKESHGA